MNKKCVSKKCKHKGVLQPIENFHRSVLSSDNYSDICKDCRRELGRKHTAKKKEARDFYKNFIL